jgi:hypothetical protein
MGPLWPLLLIARELIEDSREAPRRRGYLNASCNSEFARTHSRPGNHSERPHCHFHQATALPTLWKSEREGDTRAYASAKGFVMAQRHCAAGVAPHFFALSLGTFLDAQGSTLVRLIN